MTEYQPEWIRCKFCRGSGHMRVDGFKENCPFCSGTGKIWAGHCDPAPTDQEDR